MKNIFALVVLSSILLQNVSAEDEPLDDDGSCSIPSGIEFGEYSGNPQCVTGFGFEYGWKMDGCVEGVYTLDSNPRDGVEVTGTCPTAAFVEVVVTCNEDESATISWTDPEAKMAIKIKGGNGGQLYDATEASSGTFFAPRNKGGSVPAISHIEICLQCEGCGSDDEEFEEESEFPPLDSGFCYRDMGADDLYEDHKTYQRKPPYDEEDGSDYRGDVHDAAEGMECQRWDSQEPHKHTMTPEKYPDKDLDSNYCRNPDGKANGPWCFTSDPDIEWRYCEIGIRPIEKLAIGSETEVFGVKGRLDDKCKLVPNKTSETEDKKSEPEFRDNKPEETKAPKTEPADKPEPTTPKKGSSSGDPHFKTWTGDKYDYHGECDLVLVDSPTFADGLGLKLHIRTTRVKYFSFIEKVALQIGSDVLEFDNDVENFMINGAKVEENHKHHKTMLGGYVIRRDPKAISVRLADGTGQHQDTGRAKIDFHMRKNGFPAVIVDAGHSDLFKGSLGLLGEWGTGRKLARDGETVMESETGDYTAFALEWQVRDTEPMLFQEARFPQFPTTCTPPAKMVANRLGAQRMRKEAEEACAHWKEDRDDCVFDVMATQDVLVASEGHIVHIE